MFQQTCTHLLTRFILWLMFSGKVFNANGGKRALLYDFTLVTHVQGAHLESRKSRIIFNTMKKFKKNKKTLQENQENQEDPLGK